MSIGNKVKFWGIAGLALAVAALSGCETARDPEILDNPNYAQGYSDGCQTGHSRIAGFDDTVTKDRELSQREPAYEIGWRDGYNACGGQNTDSDTNRDIFETDSEHWDSVPR
jgi:hypothetical protein